MLDKGQLDAIPICAAQFVLVLCSAMVHPRFPYDIAGCNTLPQ
jgi:hypothetical protein